MYMSRKSFLIKYFYQQIKHITKYLFKQIFMKIFTFMQKFLNKMFLNHISVFCL